MFKRVTRTRRVELDREGTSCFLFARGKPEFPSALTKRSYSLARAKRSALFYYEQSEVLLFPQEVVFDTRYYMYK